MLPVSQRRHVSDDEGWSSDDTESRSNGDDVSSESGYADVVRAPVLLRMVHALAIVSSAVARVDLVRTRRLIRAIDYFCLEAKTSITTFFSAMPTTRVLTFSLAS